MSTKNKGVLISTIEKRIASASPNLINNELSGFVLTPKSVFFILMRTYLKCPFVQSVSVSVK